MLYGNKGGSKIAVLIYLLVAILVIYAGIKTIPLYMRYYTMDDEVGQQLRTLTINSDEVVIDDVFKKAQELELPIQREDIKLVHNEDGSVTFDMKWVEIADYGYGFKREFPFELSTNTKKLKE